MQLLKNIFNFIATNKKFFLFIVTPALVLAIFCWLTMRKPTPKYDALNNPILEQIQKEQGERIENLESIVLQLRQEIADKSVQDSILQVVSKKKIIELQFFIQNIKSDNEKKHILNSNTDINQSYDILTNNIKKRKQK